MEEFVYEEWLGSHIRPLDRIAIEKAPYDAVFYIAVYHHADLRLKKDADRAWKDIKKLFPVGAKQEDVDWKLAYSVQIERILRDRGFETYIDRSGSFCWKDGKGTHCGDGYHEYPWYDMAMLEKALA